MYVYDYIYIYIYILPIYIYIYYIHIYIYIYTHSLLDARLGLAGVHVLRDLSRRRVAYKTMFIQYNIV